MQKTCFFLFLTLCFTTLQAQEAVVTSGGELSGNGGQASYTIGQTVYHTTVVDGGASFEGVQQPLYYVVSGEVVIIEHHSGQMLICENKDGRWYSFKWYRDDVLIDVKNYTYEENGLNGIYYLVVTDADGDEHYSQQYSYSTDEVSAKSLLIYPVPLAAGEHLNIVYSDTEEANIHVPFQLYDVEGKCLIEDEVILGQRLTINTSRLKPGVYTISVANEISKIIIH